MANMNFKGVKIAASLRSDNNLDMENNVEKEPERHSQQNSKTNNIEKSSQEQYFLQHEDLRKLIRLIYPNLNYYEVDALIDNEGLNLLNLASKINNLNDNNKSKNIVNTFKRDDLSVVEAAGYVAAISSAYDKTQQLEDLNLEIENLINKPGNEEHLENLLNKFIQEANNIINSLDGLQTRLNMYRSTTGIISVFNLAIEGLTDTLKEKFTKTIDILAKPNILAKDICGDFSKTLDNLQNRLSKITKPILNITKGREI